MADDARERRREARANWPVRRFRLGEEPSADLSATTTPAERWHMMARLAIDAWALSRAPWPDYARADMPVSVRRLHDD